MSRPPGGGGGTQPPKPPDPMSLSCGDLQEIQNGIMEQFSSLQSVLEDTGKLKYKARLQLKGGISALQALWDTYNKAHNVKGC